MRLLNTTAYELEMVIGVHTPTYAILSHTWNKDEFVFEDLAVPIASQLSNPKRGLVKVLKACELARGNGLGYLWVDTCCIDKSSSSELSEAINSMFQWYRRAAVCYVWLEDVILRDGEGYGFDESRWFRRGWTLQELIAPHNVEFYDAKWDYMDNRYALAARIARVTNIRLELLQRKHYLSGTRQPLVPNADWICPHCHEIDDLKRELWSIPISVRMSWARGRFTTRMEDRAYCLLGLFDVNMAMLYGEGEKSFKRLLNEKLQNNADSSILLWQQRRGLTMTSCLPPSLVPGDFFNHLPLFKNSMWTQPEIVATPHGLSVAVLLQSCSEWKEYARSDAVASWDLAVLSPTAGDTRTTAVGVFVELSSLDGPGASPTYRRVASYTTVKIRPHEDSRFAIAEFDLQRDWGKLHQGSILGSPNYIKQALKISSSFIEKQITILNTEMVSWARHIPLRVSIQSACYFIRAIYPPLLDGDEHHNTELSFQSNDMASEGVLVALLKNDFSTGFLLFWMNQANPAVIASAWPSILAEKMSVPAGSAKELDNEQWVADFWRMLKGRHSSTPLMSSDTIQDFGVEARVVMERFVGIVRAVLVVKDTPTSDGL